MGPSCVAAAGGRPSGHPRSGGATGKRNVWGRRAAEAIGGTRSTGSARIGGSGGWRRRLAAGVAAAAGSRAVGRRWASRGRDDAPRPVRYGRLYDAPPAQSAPEKRPENDPKNDPAVPLCTALYSPASELSIGLGEAEWVAGSNHGGRGRRDWRKLHLGVDQSGVILVHTLTEATGDDATSALDLLNAVEGPLVRVTADAAYDTVAVYETATARGATVVIPPVRTANVSGHGLRSAARDRTITWVKAARTAPQMEEGVRVPSSEPGGEHVLPLQVHHWSWPSRPEPSWPGE